MQLRLLIPILMISAGLFLSSCEDSITSTDSLDRSNEVMALQGHGPKATGNAGLLEANDSTNFAFNALYLPNGSINGSFTSANDSIPFHMHGNVTCLTVVQDTAILTGVITKVGGDIAAEVGDYVWWKVVDNGEGELDPTDLFSDFYIMAADPACRDDDVNMLEIDFGNVQVFE